MGRVLGEGQGQDAAVRKPFQQIGDPPREHRGLSGSGSGQDQHSAVHGGSHRRGLLGVQPPDPFMGGGPVGGSGGGFRMGCRRVRVDGFGHLAFNARRAYTCVEFVCLHV